MKVPGLLTSFVRLSVPLQGFRKVQPSDQQLLSRSSKSPSALWATGEIPQPLGEESSSLTTTGQAADAIDEMKPIIDACPKIVVFGRPGAGKTTIANAAIDLVLDDTNNDNSEGDKPKIVGLDLDVCVPQWMKDNFAKGIYPTLAERQDFAVTCCDYVEAELIGQVTGTKATTPAAMGENTKSETQKNNEQYPASSTAAAIISFSFVNTDLREVFRSRFPDAIWVLVDTSEEQANIRIQTRKDHFYKGEQPQKKQDEEEEEQKIEQDENRVDENIDVDNSEWKFAPVTFSHTILDGSESIDVNAKKVADIVSFEIAERAKTT